jgi:DNA-directed RNA polymerase specialized sigma subunit
MLDESKMEALQEVSGRRRSQGRPDPTPRIIARRLALPVEDVERFIEEGRLDELLEVRSGATPVEAQTAVEPTTAPADPTRELFDTAVSALRQATEALEELRKLVLEP